MNRDRCRLFETVLPGSLAHGQHAPLFQSDVVMLNGIYSVQQAEHPAHLKFGQVSLGPNERDFVLNRIWYGQ